MAQKPSFLKKITTASTIAFAAAAIVGTGSTAFGAAPNGVITAANAKISDVVAGGTWHDITPLGADGADGGNAVNGPADNFAITYGGVHTIDADVAGRVITAVNANGKAAGAITVTKSLSIGSIVNTAGVQLVPITGTADQVLTLTGTAAVAATHGFDAAVNTYTAAGAIDFANTNFVVTVNATKAGTKAAPIIIPATAANNNANGVLNITTGDFIQFNKASIANTKTINIADNQTLMFNVVDAAGGTLNLQNVANSPITFGATGKGTLTLISKAGGGNNAANFKVANGTLGGAVDNQGIIFFDTSAAAGQLQANAAGNTAVVGVDDTHRAKSFIVQATGVNAATIKNNIFAANVELQGGAITFEQTVNVGNAGTTAFTTAGSQATISKPSNLGVVTFGAFAGNTLTLTSAAANTTLTGNFTGDATAANFPTLLFAGANTSALAAADKTQPVVKNFKAIENTVAQAVTLGAGTYTTDLNISNANGSFILADGFELTGNVNATKGVNALAAGKLTAQGNATISGDIGFNATVGKGQTPLSGITVADVAGKTLTLGGANIIGAGNINYGANVGGIVKLTNTTAPNIRVEYNLVLAADAKGVFDASSLTDKQTLTISGSIGTFDAAVAPATIKTASKSLEQLVIGEGNLVLSAGDSAINSLVMGDNSTVTLAHNTYKIVTSNSGGNGTVVISPDVADPNNGTTLASGTKLGDNGSSLKEIKFKLTGVTQGGTDVTLNVGQNVNLYATNITTDTKNKGSFSFTSGGTSIVSGQVGTSASKLNAVAIKNGTTVQFKNLVFFAGATTIDATSTLQIGGAYQADSIGGVGADQGTVEFINTTPIILNPANAGNAISTIKVSGSDNVTLTKAFGAKNIAFGKNSPRVALSLAAADKIQGVTITSTAGGIGNAPVVVTAFAGDAIDVGQAVGDANNIVNIGLGGDIAFTVNEGTNFFGGIAPVNNGQGTVTLNAANGGQVYGLGLPGQKLKTVIVAKNTTNFGDTYVSGNTLRVDDNTIYTAEGIIDAGIQLGSTTGVGSKIVFKNGTNLLSTSTVKALVANNGTATFEGSAQVGNLGVSGTSFALVEFTGPNGSKASLQGAIYSQNINFNNYDIAVVSNSTLSGASAINGNINLNTNVLTFAGGVSTWAADTTITTTFTNASSAGFPNGTLGNIVIKDGGSVTAAGTIKTLIVDNQGDINVTINNASSIYPFITGGANLTSNGQPLNLVNADTIVTSNQQFIKWNLVKSGTDYVLQPSDNRNAVIANAFTTNPVNIPGLDDNIATLTNIKNTGNASATITNFGNFKSSADLTQAIVAVVTDVDALIDNVIDNTTEHFSSIIGNRVEVARYAQLPVGAADDADDNVSYGTWLKPVYTDATQKGIKGTPGYSAKTTGGIFGFDTMANDNLMVGAAIGINQTKIKYKNYKSGDKSTVNGFLVSLYGAQQLVDNFFVQGGATFNLSQIKTKSQRYMANASGQKIAETATSNYDNMTFGGNVMLGYDAKLMDGVLLTPMAGISYLKSGDESYKETGTTLLNKQVASKFSDKTDVIVGAKVLGDVMNLSGFAFYPEAHAFVTHKVSGKYAKTQSKLDGQVDFMTGLPDKSAKTSYNLGLSIAARPGPQMEYGIGYDANLASKYVAHTGTLKVRVNF